MIINSHSTVEKDGASRNKGKLPYTSSTLFAGKDRPYFPTCVYCNQQHSSLKCNVATKPDARRAILRRKGKCFSCLKSGHLAKNCATIKRHHTSICEGENNNLKGPTETKNVGTSSMCGNSNTAVLLQTAQVYVDQPGSEHEVKAIESDTLKITAFGVAEPTQNDYEQVQFSIKAIDGMELYAKVYVVPTICNLICSQTIEAAVEKYPHLQGLCLAEKSYFPNEVEVDHDVLLGADYYWNFVTNIIRKGRSPGPVAWTKLGWALSGPVITSSSDNYDRTTVNLSSTYVLRVETSTIQL